MKSILQSLFCDKEPHKNVICFSSLSPTFPKTTGAYKPMVNSVLKGVSPGQGRASLVLILSCLPTSARD